MPKKIQVTIAFNQDLESILREKFSPFQDFRIISRSLDARNANRGRVPKYNYVVELIREQEDFTNWQEEFSSLNNKQQIKPIIVGLGPAGIFAALRLLEYGIPSIIVERGAPAMERMLAISKYWRYGQLDEDNNVCYGEGGAGLFSDGKLITRIKSPYVKYVMQKLVAFGAPEYIAYESNPHLGSNKMRRLIGQITKWLTDQGCTIFYHTRMSELLYSADKKQVRGIRCHDGREFYGSDVILATGHSAKDVYQRLLEDNLELTPKDFAIGVRIEHPRTQINHLQFGKFAKYLPAARYRLSYHNQQSDRGCFSFCMCPGGHVLSTSTEVDGLVVNGMSNFHHNSKWSNAALVVAVKQGVDFAREGDPVARCLDAINYQREIEQKAYQRSVEFATGKELPAMRARDFLLGQKSKSLPASSIPSKTFSDDLTTLFPEVIVTHLQQALEKFNRQIKGFLSADALLIAPETRTSAPLTIVRDKQKLHATKIRNLYPCGEGAGYAGGITSAAVDGIRVVEMLLSRFH